MALRHSDEISCNISWRVRLTGSPVRRKSPARPKEAYDAIRTLLNERAGGGSIDPIRRCAGNTK
jgi:hypothetical protein